MIVVYADLFGLYIIDNRYVVTPQVSGTIKGSIDDN